MDQGPHYYRRKDTMTASLNCPNRLWRSLFVATGDADARGRICASKGVSAVSLTEVCPRGVGKLVAHEGCKNHRHLGGAEAVGKRRLTGLHQRRDQYDGR